MTEPRRSFGRRLRETVAGGLLVVVLCVLPESGLAQQAGVRGIVPFTGAAVAYQEPLGRSQLHSVPVDRIARVDGTMQPRTSREVQGRSRSVTWGHPRGVSADAVYAHLRAQLPDEAWYECRSRDCGPSTYWAHRHFGVADLYGRDGSQFYTAILRATAEGTVLTMLYVVERGTREVMAHVEEILLEQPAKDAVDPALLARALADTGVVRLPPANLFDGARLTSDANDLLGVLERAVQDLPVDAELWFVVHRRDAGRGGVRALEDSGDQATALAAAFGERLPERYVGGLGVGALVPGVLRDEEMLVQLVVQRPAS